MLLTLTNSKDVHVSNVLRILNHREVPWFRLNIEDFSGSSAFSFSSDLSGFQIVVSQVSETPIDINAIDCVWASRFGECPYQNSNDIEATQIAAREYRVIREVIAYELENVKWVSPISALRRADNKLHVLKLALELGIKCPKTIVTQDVATAIEFVRSCEQGAITKQLSSHYGLPGQGHMIFTSTVGPNELDKISSVKWCPTLFQEKVNRKFECRLILVGTDSYAVAKQPRTKTREIDWRKLSSEDVDLYPISLPNTDLTMYYNLMQMLGLNYAVIDLIATHDGQFIFLELNPNGVWNDLQHVSGFEIDGSMANLIKELMDENKRLRK